MRGASPHPSGAAKAKTSGSPTTLQAGVAYTAYGNVARDMKLSEAFGLHGMRSKVTTDVGRLVGLAIAMDRPVLIEVPGR